MTEITENVRLLWAEGDTMTVGDLMEYVNRLGDADHDDELTITISQAGNSFTIEGDKGD